MKRFEGGLIPVVAGVQDGLRRARKTDGQKKNGAGKRQQSPVARAARLIVVIVGQQQIQTAQRAAKDAQGKPSGRQKASQEGQIKINTVACLPPALDGE